MAKRNKSNPYFHNWDKPHFISVDDVESLVLEVFTIIWTSKNLTTSEVRRPLQPLVRLVERQAEKRLSSCLLQLAILMRTLDELAVGEPLYDQERKQLEGQHRIGTVYDPNPDVHVTSELPFREACNKIIHAGDVRPTYEKDGPEEHWALSGMVELAGRKGKKVWLVDIDVFRFLTVCLRLVKVKPSAPPEEKANGLES